MQLNEGREAYYTSSKTVSEITRQLALAGVAVVWLLSGGLQASEINLTSVQLAAGAFLASAVLFDLIQYVWTTGNFAVWVWWKEKKLREKGDNHNPSVDVDQEKIGDVPAHVLPVMWVFFYAKVVAICVAYGFIFGDLFGRIKLP
ncbi:hypothetical protein [Streptomyces sp. KR80]|uniref:hypothetical protein n=1 Tax=Streptomyces sp. KR80 TaxID=3457426 RepID=UPI003FD640EF